MISARDQILAEVENAITEAMLSYQEDYGNPYIIEGYEHAIQVVASL